MDCPEELDHLQSSRPPAYSTVTSPFAITVNFKQSVPFIPHGSMITNKAYWSRLLGSATSREWLHSSGILCKCALSIPNDLPFEAFESRIRERLTSGMRGGPPTRLCWTYILRGRWMGGGREIISIEVTEESWEDAQALSLIHI